MVICPTGIMQEPLAGGTSTPPVQRCSSDEALETPVKVRRRVCEKPSSSAAAQQPPDNVAKWVELFGGRALLTMQANLLGFDGIAVDYTRNASKPVAPTALIDLTTSTGQQQLDANLGDGLIQAVMSAPPCGTSSRAREKPISKRLKAMGAPEPKPCAAMPSLKAFLPFVEST